MGTYDTVHIGTRHAQTKGLGKSLYHYILRDRVWLVPSPSYVFGELGGGERLEGV